MRPTGTGSPIFIWNDSKKTAGKPKFPQVNLVGYLKATVYFFFLHARYRSEHDVTHYTLGMSNYLKMELSLEHLIKEEGEDRAVDEEARTFNICL